MPDHTPRLLPPRVVVADGGPVDAGRRELVKRPVVAVPLVLWLLAWSFWALWGIFVPLMVLVVGRNPRGVWKEIAGFLQYVLRVTAYLSLTVEPFPGYRNKNPATTRSASNSTTRSGSHVGSPSLASS
jgi:hypothetical protein